MWFFFSILKSWITQNFITIKTRILNAVKEKYNNGKIWEEILCCGIENMFGMFKRMKDKHVWQIVLGTGSKPKLNNKLF
jgi:hypothetical protein